MQLILNTICSCLKVILDNLEKLSKPNINALLHEFGFQVWLLLYAPQEMLSVNDYPCL